MENYHNLPSTVKIGQREIKIFVRDSNTDPELFDSDAYCISSDTIVLRTGLSASLCRSTLLHELLHSLKFVRENNYIEKTYKRKGNDKVKLEDWEHYFIGIYQEGLVCLLRDNPKLVTFLTA